MSTTTMAGTESRARRSALLLVSPSTLPQERDGLRDLFLGNGFDVVLTQDERDAMALLRERTFEIALVDVGAPGLERLLADPPSRGLVVVAPFTLLEETIRNARRELASAVIRAALLSPTRSTAPPEVREPVDNLRQAKLEFERVHVRRLLERHGGDKVRVAEALGIDLSSLYRKLHQLGWDDEKKLTPS